MSIGLPKLELAFKAAAEMAAERSKQGIAAVIVLEPAMEQAVVTPCVRVGDIPASPALGETNLAHLKRAFVGSELGAPRRVLVCAAPDLSAGLAALESHSVDYVAGPPDLDDLGAAEIAGWVKARREALIPVRAVLPEYDGDSIGIINYSPCPTGERISVGAQTVTAAEYCARIAGVLAGIPVACSSTGAVLEEVSAVPRWPNPDTAVDEGKLILIHDGIRTQIARGVNSLVTLEETGAEEWKKIKIVEGMDLITYFLRTTINTSYRGKYPNSFDNKMLLVGAIKTYLEFLEERGVLDAGSSWVGIDLDAQRDYLRGQGLDVDNMTDQQVREHKTGSWVFLAFGATLLDAMEDFVLTGTLM